MMKTGDIENIGTWLGAALSAVLCVLGLASCSSDKPDNFEPQLQTLEAIDITRNEATMGGNVTPRGLRKRPNCGSATEMIRP